MKPCEKHSLSLASFLSSTFTKCTGVSYGPSLLGHIMGYLVTLEKNSGIMHYSPFKVFGYKIAANFLLSFILKTHNIQYSIISAE